MMSDRFLALAEAQISNPRKARLRAAEKRAARKVAEEREQLDAAWRRWHSGRREKALIGPHGDFFRDLIIFLESMTLGSGAALVAAVEGGPWKHADADTKFEALSLIDAAITTLRERHGLSTFSDPLPHEAPGVFQVIREVLA